ncbi:MAG: FHA domain-containing protein [Bdellovibrionales bacterium]|nr:FHA domain-containing protein [Bdellovibrionales bacterium]
MKLRFVVDVIGAKGQKETAHSDFDQDAVVLGRGGSSDVIYESSLVSLEHLRISGDGHKLLLEDLDSLSGVRVNGKQTRRQELRVGDRITFGEIELVIRKVGETFELYEERRQKEKEDSDVRVKRLVQQLDPKRNLPSMTLLSIFLAALVLIGFFGYPLSIPGKPSWNSGPLSNAHKMIEADCSLCHVEPFEPVQDKACLTCHEMSVHAEAFEHASMSDSHEEPRCAACHMEHNGDAGLTVSQAKLCTECHANIRATFADAESPNVMSFADHPEFSVSIPVGDEGDMTRIRLSDRERLIDGTKLKLNHHVHLKKGIAGPDGPTDLHCTDCHRLTPETELFEPITYENDCASCHTLGFDDRLPELEVPHGDADTVYHFAYAEYAKLFLDAQQGPPVPGFERFKPGSEPREPDQREFVKDEVDRAARDAEELLFTKTACHLCHDIQEKESFDRLVEGRYEVMRPKIPSSWMSAALFDHAAHQEVRCESCHEGVSKSTETTDVLLPGVKTCQSCHGDAGAHGKVGSDCILCHSYHDQVLLPESKKRAIEDIVDVVNRVS